MVLRRRLRPFVIGIAATLITKGWNLSSARLGLLNSTMLAATAAHDSTTTEIK